MLSELTKQMKTTIAAIPLVGPVLRHLRRKYFPKPSFTTSSEYWERLYSSGGNSGEGSYNAPARFKAAILNQFVRDHRINTILEWGHGDGNQLRLATYSHYVGVDVSKTAVNKCRRIFADDHSKRFFLIDELPAEDHEAECALSLDVIYHLVEDEVYFSYMKRLFASATRFVVIYAWDVERDAPVSGGHVRHRAFLKWVNENVDGWFLLQTVKNDDDHYNSTVTFARFYFFVRQDSCKYEPNSD
jgi:hypothetical protein